MVVNRTRRPLQPPNYRTSSEVPASPYADHLARTAKENARHRRPPEG